jgi:hypothetical protein
MEYLRPVLRETKTLEETAEAIIPDRDVSEIQYTGGMAVLRGRDVTDGAATVSVGVSASVLAGEEGGPGEVVEVYIPMSLRFDNPALKPGQLTQAQVQLRRLDAHLVSPRKILVRATAAVTLWVWETCRQEHFRPKPGQDLEILERTQPLNLLVALGEKTYTLEDFLRLTPEGAGKTLVDSRVTLTHTESRLTGTRAVLKGNAAIWVLYRTDSGDLQTGQAQLPFSQYIDLGAGQETDQLRLRTALAGADLELTTDGGGVNVTLQLLTQAEVWAAREVTVVADLYSLTAQAEPTWAETAYESLLDRQYFAPVGRGTIPDREPPLALDCLVGEVSHTRNGETVEFTLPVRVQALTRQRQTMTAAVNLTFRTQAAAGCRFEVEAEDLTAAANPTGDGLDIQVSATVCLGTFAAAQLPEITGAEVTDLAQEPPRPGLVIRRAALRESLWDLAKQYRTTRAAIMAANGLTGELAADTLLLIPGGR